MKPCGASGGFRVFCPDTLTKATRTQAAVRACRCLRSFQGVAVVLALHVHVLYAHTATHTLRLDLSVNVWMGTVKVSI